MEINENLFLKHLNLNLLFVIHLNFSNILHRENLAISF